MLLVSNNGLINWTEMFSNQVIASAILDWLAHHATTLNINGERPTISLICR